jgi:hypothetical protein
MATLLAQQDEEVENALQLIYRRYIRMQELRMHIRETAQEIGVIQQLAEPAMPG